MVSALLLLGCPDDPREPWEPAPPVPNAIESADTGEPGPFAARHIYVEAQFGHNAVDSLPATVDLAGLMTVPPRYAMYLADPRWTRDLADTAMYCYIFLPFENGVASPVADADPRLLWGAQYRYSADAPETNCNTPGWQLEPEVWGNDPLRDFVAPDRQFYHAAVGEPTALILQEVLPLLPPELQPFLVGGELSLPSALGNRVEDVYAFAYHADDSMTVEFDPTGRFDPIEAETLLQGPLPSAWITVDSYWFWSLE